MNRRSTDPPIAVVPARGGSKRIPKKNVRPFHGVPLLARTIMTVARTDAFDRIVVSTDDEEIAAVAVDAGAEAPFRRPPELADDHTPTAPVIAHAIQQLEDRAGAPVGPVCVIYPTAILMTTDDLSRARTLLDGPDVDYVVACAPYPAPIERALRRGRNDRCEMVYPEHRLTRTQDLPESYHDAGQFYWGQRDAWVEQRSIFNTSTRLYRLPSWRVQDIDTPDDWTRAELLFQLLDHATDQ